MSPSEIEALRALLDRAGSVGAQDLLLWIVGAVLLVDKFWWHVNRLVRRRVGLAEEEAQPKSFNSNASLVNAIERTINHIHKVEGLLESMVNHMSGLSRQQEKTSYAIDKMAQARSYEYNALHGQLEDLKETLHDLRRRDTG